MVKHSCSIAPKLRVCNLKQGAGGDQKKGCQRLTECQNGDKIRWQWWVIVLSKHLQLPDGRDGEEKGSRERIII